MFDKVKKANEWRKAQSQMEKLMDQIFVTEERAGIKVTVTANNKIMDVQINGEENKILKELINEALKSARKKAEKKMRSQATSLGLDKLL